MADYSLSKARRFITGFERHRFYVGLDVHKRSYHVALRRSDGRALSWVAPASPAQLLSSLSVLKLKIGAVAYEAGPTGFRLARELARAGLEVIVAAPSRIPRPCTRGAKTDRLDCIRLAEYVAKGLLNPIAVPSESDEAKRSLVRRRHQLADNLRKVKTRIKALLLYMGVDEPKGLSMWTRGSIRALNQIELENAARWTMDSLLLELSSLEENLAMLKSRLTELSEDKVHRKAIECFKSMPGVGPIVANTFVLELFRPERFSRGEEVASYLGLAPVVRQSGESHKGGKIRPVGQKRLKSLLVEAAWVWRAKDPWANAIYGRLLSRTGIAQKAIVGLARKLAVILWRLIMEQRPYRQELVKT